MNEKLIQRAAIKYRNWLLSKAQSSVNSEKTPIIKRLHEMSYKVEQIEKWAQHFFGGSEQRLQVGKWDDKPHMGIVCSSAYDKIATDMIPELGRDVVHVTQHIIATLQSLVTGEIITKISLREAINEIRAIVKAWPEVKFKEGVLSVLVHNITLEDDVEEIYLGSFWMCIDFTTPFNSLRIRSVDCIKSNNGYYHPHVSDAKLCIGAGDLLSNDAMYQGRLEDYFRIIEAVMRTYNEKSPYTPLKSWYEQNHEGEFFCEKCAEWRSNEDSCLCEACQIEYCGYCDDGGCCAECGEWRCNDCITFCEKCEKTICHECTVSCYECSNILCSSCLSECNVCCRNFCESCKSSCTNCGDSVCNDCMAMCGCCTENYCTNCINKTCETCNKGICKECQTTCEHCGISMCGICESKHNCLLKEVESST